MAPQPASASRSREGSLDNHTTNSLSRRTSAQSAASNVFSDDHAYSDGDLTPFDSLQPSLDLTRPPRPHNPPQITTTVPTSALPLSFNSTDRPLSTSQRAVPSITAPLPHRSFSIATESDAGSRRTFSTSSRFSMPRSQSPYNGPTAPTQPYAMYPQVTRASSVASDATLRPPERPFVPQGGPEHPYGMYQNTVPEEDDDDDDSLHHPLRFPRMGSSFRDGASSSGNDTGDIVGSDGHIEQLPAYSRYADNVIAKGDMGSIDIPPSGSAQSDPALSDSGLELTRPRGQMEEEQAARKEGWYAKSKTRKCCGMPLLAVVVMCLVVSAAAVMGGIIGGVIGNQKGVDKTLAFPGGATTTVWLDADPAATGPATPPCPTGRYVIPFNNTQQISSCVVDQVDYGITWDCMNQAWLGIALFDNGPNKPYQVAFDDYSVRAQAFEYGPQPPDFNGTMFDLQPVTDKEDDKLGVAWFFSHLFDKLVILEADVLMPPPPGSGKRSVPAHHIRQRSYNPGTARLQIGDKPWYCFWNSTIEEFWIFVQQDVKLTTSMTTTSTSTTATKTGSSKPSETTTSSSSSSIPTASKYLTGNTTPPTGTKVTTGATPTNTWPASKVRRSSPYSDPNSPNTFPKLIKMVEKRKPHSNIQPYCQQMQVLNDWQIMPIPLVPTICIVETEFAKPTGGSKRTANPVVLLESECICEWFSAPNFDVDLR